MTATEMTAIPALKFTVREELDITPSFSSSANDFDFYTGKWTIHNKKLKERLKGSNEWISFEATGEMHTILNGTGNIDTYCTSFDGKPFEGFTLRLFNPATRLWSIYWADSIKGKLDTPVIGSFENNIGHFFAKDDFDGRPILVVFRWDTSNKEKPVWSQAFSADNGKTWEWNWYMYFSKADS
jgi:hypothetical protein